MLNHNVLIYVLVRYKKDQVTDYTYKSRRNLDVLLLQVNSVLFRDGNREYSPGKNKYN
jgi:hypothetical protein